MLNQEFAVVWLAMRNLVRSAIKEVCVNKTVLMVVGLAVFSESIFAGDGALSKEWHEDFRKAEALAKENEMPLLVHFHAHWCGPCRAMESDVLNTSEVKAALGSGIIGVKVNSDEHRELVSQFGVTALPTDVIVSPEGKVLSKTVGSPGRTAYVARLNQFRVPASAPAAASNTLVAQAAPATAKAPVTAVSSGQTVDVQPEPEKSAEQPDAESAIVALDSTATTEDAEKPEVDEAANGQADSSAASGKATVAMTKTLRRESGERIGLSGYSPVSLTDSEKWKTGDAQFKFEFQGVCYLLSSPEELDRFKANPEKFVPALHGCDPVALVNDQIIQAGHIELGVTYRSRVYFFTSQKSRDEFLGNPEKFAATHNLAFFKTEKGSEG